MQLEYLPSLSDEAVRLLWRKSPASQFDLVSEHNFLHEVRCLLRLHAFLACFLVTCCLTFEWAVFDCVQSRCSPACVHGCCIGDNICQCQPGTSIEHCATTW